jgi:hypothetical protein
MFKQVYALARQLLTLMQDVQKLKAEQKEFRSNRARKARSSCSRSMVTVLFVCAIDMMRSRRSDSRLWS